MPEFGTSEAGSAVQPCPLKKEPPGTGWLAIKLIGEDNKPFGWEEYVVVVPGGDTIKGFLDEEGCAKIENLKEGTCRVCFPKIDAKDWTKVTG
jgi:hypothetical protein